MTNERREELKNKLAGMALSFDAARKCFDSLTPEDARDILAMLREGEALPWSFVEEIAQEAHTMGRVYANGGERTNPADEFMRVTEMIKRRRSAAMRGDGAPDDASEPHDDGVCECLDEAGCTCKLNVQPAGELPAITFRPWTPPRPTLDQMPEGEPHRCKGPLKPQCVMMLHDGKACSVLEDGRPDTVSEFSADRYTVLDADPPPPETLADVPKGVWCETDFGVVYRDPCGDVRRACGELVTSLDADGYPVDVIADDVTITRVLGFMQIGGAE